VNNYLAVENTVIVVEDMDQTLDLVDPFYSHPSYVEVVGLVTMVADNFVAFVVVVDHCLVACLVMLLKNYHYLMEVVVVVVVVDYQQNPVQVAGYYYLELDCYYSFDFVH
jgi:hypothetical protein